METHFSRAQAAQRKTEILQTFGRLLKFAKENAVGAVIVAGDLFDGKNVSLKTKNYVLDAVEACPADFLYLSGNHDEDGVFDKDGLPPNLKRFGDGFGSFSYGNVVISGIRLSGKNEKNFYDEISLDKSKQNIVALHGQSKYALGEAGAGRTGEATANRTNCAGELTVNIAALKNKNIDYLALGHYHSYKCAEIDGRGIYVYSGCLEGRGFDECGDKGFVLLDTGGGNVAGSASGAGVSSGGAGAVGGGKIAHTFVKFAKRTFYDIDVSISGLRRVKQIEDAVTAAVGALPQDAVVKVRLTGAYDTETQIDLVHLNEILNGTFYFGRTVNESRLKINIDDYKSDVSLKGEFIRNVLSADLPDKLKDDVIMTGLNALS
jgi:DNA repair exonuclease SbcCD nuclease subunit